MNNRIVDSWLKNKDDFPGWSALKWLEFVLTDEHDAVAQSWTTDEVMEATDLFTHPVFGGQHYDA